MHNVFRSILRVTVTGVLAAGLGLPVQTGHAQPQHQRKVEFRVQHFTTAEGLPSNEVFSIQEDSLGFLWLGTTNGLVRYDGYTFTSFLPQPNDSTSIGGRQILALHVDATGRLWAGGGWGILGGLSRFDYATESFTRYQHDPDDPNSLIHDAVRSIYASRREPGVIWIGSYDGSADQGGLSRLNLSSASQVPVSGQTPAAGVFTNYSHDPGDPSSIPVKKVWTLLEDRQGTLWIGTTSRDETGGLHRFDPETNTFTTFLPHPQHAPDVPMNSVRSVYEDRAGTLWVGSESGLHRFEPERGVFTSFFPQPADLSDRSNWVGAILEDRAGVLWIGTNDGLYTFDRESKRFTRFQHPPSGISSFHEDRFGVLWVGSGRGLMKLERHFNPFKIIQPDSHDPNLAGGQLIALSEDDEGLLWLVAQSSGTLYRMDRETRVITGSWPVSEQLNSIYLDQAGVLWLGGSDVGVVYRMNADQPGRFTRFRHDANDPGSLGRGSVYHPLEDQAGHLWIPIWGSGIDRMDRETETFTHYTPDSHGLGDDQVTRLYEASSEPGILWAGTQSGLSRFDTATERFTNYHAENLRRTTMMHEDRQGRFWVATASSGLHLFNRETGLSDEVFTTEDGLAHNIVRSIYEDNQGFLWLSTENGLSKFDPERRAFRNYYERDGLPGNAFRGYAHHQSASGELFFGGPNGWVSFFPEEIVDNPVPPEVVLTGLQIAGEPVEIGPGSPLEASMMVTEAVTLSHGQNDLTFEYVGLHFIDPARNRYRHRMEGYDADWVEAGTQRTVRYTNLDPGEYVFRVTASNGDSPWNEEEALVRITIRPPWWRTTWAYLLYGLLFIAGVFAIDRVQRQRLIKKERERAAIEQAELRAEAAELQTRALKAENERKEIELEKARELEQAYTQLKATQAQLIQQEKMASLGQMTAGIAHEIKNPLNFVNNFAALSIELADDLAHKLHTHPDQPLAESLDEIEVLLEHLKRNAASINHHGRRADGIVQSMMQHASGASGERRATEVNALVEEYVNLAYHGMRAQRLDFNVVIERDYAEAAGSVEMVPQEIGRVLLNLLSNAFYAVHEQAARQDGPYAPMVQVSTHREADHVEIRVQDNGPGINKDFLAKIFEPFYTTKPTGSGNTGLGLSLSYEIVVQGHGGTLQVESAEGEGATFVVTLPANKAQVESTV